jgi:hypothetical protein
VRQPTGQLSKRPNSWVQFHREGGSKAQTPPPDRRHPHHHLILEMAQKERLKALQLVGRDRSLTHRKLEEVPRARHEAHRVSRHERRVFHILRDVTWVLGPGPGAWGEQGPLQGQPAKGGRGRSRTRGLGPSVAGGGI